ncbi:MAG: hypothetical protein NT137_03690 [Methanomassiliicoccales archaeon]|nr:hypothetical protein [Methanomassiliicoccales archaeon]
MSRARIGIDARKDRDDRRAKHTRVTINRKRVDLPLKAANISTESQIETDIAKKQVERTIINEIGLKINPKRLRAIVTSDSEHHNIKNALQNTLSDIGDSGINIAFPYFVNERSPNEDPMDFRPFPAPTEKMVQKVFDLFDIEGIDILIPPMIMDDAHELQWAKIGSSVYSTRKGDFLEEYAISGMVPYAISEETAKKITKTYLENGFESLTFDCGGAKIKQSRMRGIIDSVPNWDSLLIHGTNVPHFNWHGTHASSVQPTYDLLVSVYGFDSFGGMRRGFDADPETPQKIQGKIPKKRYYTTDTYGAYTCEGLKKLMESHTLRCQCPTCSRIKSPIDIYNRSNTNEDLKALQQDLKIHRLHAAHKEMSQASKLIDKGKYLDHVSDKKAATKELQTILNAISRQKTSEDF